MAGGGHVIIRSYLVAPANDPTVQGALAAWKKAKLQAILAKGAAEWTRLETRFVLNCIDEADESFGE